jgi:hypothetical protein
MRCLRRELEALFALPQRIDLSAELVLALARANRGAQRAHQHSAAHGSLENRDVTEQRHGSADRGRLGASLRQQQNGQIRPRRLIAQCLRQHGQIRHADDVFRDEQRGGAAGTELAHQLRKIGAIRTLHGVVENGR